MNNKDYRMYIYDPINKEINSLIKILQDKNESYPVRVKIFNMLCSCFKAVEKDFISYNDAEMFLSKILRVSLDSDQIHELLDAIVENGNKIYYPAILEWYLECIYILLLY